MNGEILYFYDALCSWCYGFSPVIQELSETYGDQYRFEAISGGMVPKEKEMPVGQLADFLHQAHKQVAERTGVTFARPFKENIMAQSDYVLSSVLPSYAMTVFKSLKDSDSISFAHAIQKAFFFEGQDLNDEATYANLIEGFGLSTTTFLERLHESKYQDHTHGEFKFAADLGVQGFPTLLYHHEGEYAILARGYMPLDMMQQQFEQLEVWRKQKQNA